MAEVLEVEKRERVGSSATQKLRRVGKVPAVLYGHGEKNEHLSVPASQVRTLLRHHSKTVELSGAIKDTALISEIQWDPLGIEVLHLDLIRVNLRELVEVSVAVQTYGDPVGVREGGVLIENLHQVDIRCPAGKIPDNVALNVTELHIGENMNASELELPEGVELVTPPDTTVAHIEEPRGEAALEEEVEGQATDEPEVISKGGEKAEEED
jgi:large subunit ribosomal protein L25